MSPTASHWQLENRTNSQTSSTSHVPSSSHSASYSQSNSQVSSTSHSQVPSLQHALVTHSPAHHSNNSGEIPLPDDVSGVTPAVDGGGLTFGFIPLRLAGQHQRSMEPHHQHNSGLAPSFILSTKVITNHLSLRTSTLILAHDIWLQRLLHECICLCLHNPMGHTHQQWGMNTSLPKESWRIGTERQSRR
jgi:hypothetical protein